MGDGGHNEMDSWIQLFIYSVVSLGFVTVQSFCITGRPRKQFELPFQQRIESCLLKRSVKKYRMASSVIFIDSRYISLKGMICRIYLVKRRLDTREMWKHFSNKTYVGNVMNSRNSVLTEMGQLERWLISKILLEGLALREIILSETSQIRQIFAAQEQKCRVKAPCFRSYWGKLKEDDNNW